MELKKSVERSAGGASAAEVRAASHAKAIEQMGLSMRLAAWWERFKRKHIVGDWPYKGDMQ